MCTVKSPVNQPTDIWETSKIPWHRWGDGRKLMSVKRGKNQSPSDPCSW